MGVKSGVCRGKIVNLIRRDVENIGENSFHACLCQSQANMKLVQVLMKVEQSGGRGRDELVTTWVAPLLIETGWEGGRAELVTSWIVKSCGKRKITKYL